MLDNNLSEDFHIKI